MISGFQVDFQGGIISLRGGVTFRFTEAWHVVENDMENESRCNIKLKRNETREGILSQSLYCAFLFSAQITGSFYPL